MIDHKNRPRPLSPHLTVYKAEYSSMLSIYHRVTGVLLACCLLVFGLVYKFQAYNVEYSILLFNIFNSAMPIEGPVINILITFIMFVIIFMLAYHMSNGIRHFLWDFILSTVSKEHVKLTSYGVILLTIIIFVMLGVAAN